MKNTFLMILVCFLCLFWQSCNNKDPILLGPEPPEVIVQIPCDSTMFGMPIEATGLSDSRCKPSCACLNFTSKDFTAAEIETLRAWEIDEPFAELTSSPYEEEVPDSEEMVCAVVIENLAEKLYRLENFSDAAAAEAAGAILTHHDACGLCSTLSDFAVYAEDRDIGTPVRTCAILNFANPFDSLVACIESLGFTKPCAQIWAYNTQNTRENCFDVCISSTTYHESDGSLSACLACDEEVSGPVFKAVAGRTRRNTGLASSICRFCEEVKPVPHDYPFE